MNTERDELGSTNGQKPEPAVMQAVLEALATGNRESILEVLRERRPVGSKLAAAVERANLEPAQEAMLNVLLGLEQVGMTADPADQPAPKTAEPVTGELRALERELYDLREVNDTLAAALGACPICWGGDRTCETCDGYGRAGCFRPDPALFVRLVAPAVRRVRTLTTAGGREQFYQARR
jgi:hypothetical protein